MSGAYAIVQQLLDSRQQTAIGIGHFLKALLDFAKPRVKTLIIVEHMNSEGTARVMMFSRQKLSATFSVSWSNFSLQVGSCVIADMLTY